MLSLLAATLAASTASPIATPSPAAGSGDGAPKWTDIKVANWTENLTWATILLGLATIALVGVTIWITSTDRTRDDDQRKADRADAEKDTKAQQDHDDDQRKLDREAADARLKESSVYDSGQRDKDRKAADDRLKEQQRHDDDQRDKDRQAAADRLKEQQQRADDQRDKDRKDAEQRLKDERAEIDRRVQEERDAAEARATRQQQVAAAASLLQRIAEIDEFMLIIPNLERQTQGRPETPSYEQARAAVGNLKKGALAEALALHNPTGARLYRALVRLHMDALDGHWRRIRPDMNYVPEERTVGDLRHFTRHVRLCLSHLIDTGDIPATALGPDPDVLDIPDLTRPLEDFDSWMPATRMPGWDADVQLDQYDPNRIRTSQS